MTGIGSFEDEGKDGSSWDSIAALNISRDNEGSFGSFEGIGRINEGSKFDCSSIVMGRTILYTTYEGVVMGTRYPV